MGRLGRAPTDSAISGAAGRRKSADFRKRVILWASSGHRSVPWREPPEPYRVLVAELMLRRTRAPQVAPVFVRFVKRFRTVRSLAASSEREVATLLKPLGLRWRTPAFRRVAAELVKKHSGRVPEDKLALRALPGVGDYVANAVLAFAFDSPAILVDTNTVRLAARFFGFEYGPESRRNPTVRAAVAELFEPDTPRASAVAVLDFASLVCRARLPLCAQCPVVELCAYGRANVSRRYPLGPVLARGRAGGESPRESH
jgi:A/G-specific adenine glycosylase